MANFTVNKWKNKWNDEYQWIEAEATTQTVNMHHQIYIVKQMNVCRGYNGSKGEQKHNGKYKVSLE